MTESSKNHRRIDRDACVRAALPKTILHIDGKLTLDFEKQEKQEGTSYKNRPEHNSEQKPVAEFDIHASCRFTGEGIYQGFSYGRTDQIPTDMRSEEKLLMDNETYLMHIFQATAKELLDYHELSKSPDDPESPQLIHIGAFQYKYWEYYQTHNKTKSTNPHIGFVMRDKTPHNKMIVTHGKLVSLKEYMESQPVLSQANISFQDKYHRVDLRASRIKLASPKYNEAGGSVPPTDSIIEMTCVLACFADDPSRTWFLTSNQGSITPTVQDALMIVGLYAKRAYLEDFLQTIQNIFPMIDRLTEDHGPIVKNTFTHATLTLRIAQLEHLLETNPKQKITTLFTALELKCLLMLLPELRSKPEESDPEKSDADFLEFLNYNVQETATLLKQLGRLGPPVTITEDESEMRKIALGYTFLHHFRELTFSVGEQLREQAYKLEDLRSNPSKIPTLKITI